MSQIYLHLSSLNICCSYLNEYDLILFFCVNAHSRLVYKQVPVGTDFPLANFNVRVLSVSNIDMMVPFKGRYWQKATSLVKLQVAS